MAKDSTPKVINTHWFGGVDKLPSNAIYIGRPSPYGNAYSSKSGKYTKEECVALHRVDLYASLIKNPLHIITLRNALAGHDLACWCKQHKRVTGCHGDNFLHILSDRLRERSYDRTVIHYLMDDLRHVLQTLHHRIMQDVDDKDFTFLFVHYGDVKLDIEYVLMLCKEKYVAIEDLWFFIATLVVDLELAAMDPDPLMVEYRFSHVSWAINRFIKNRSDREFEPDLPRPVLTKPSKKSSSSKEV